jgi:hypothetical protein
MIRDVLSTYALQWGARVSVRLAPPVRAARAVRRLARWLEPLDEPRARTVARWLPGTCLTRSMAVAARLPGATVAFGANRDGESLYAHAWVELDGHPLLADDTLPNVLGHLTVW